MAPFALGLLIGLALGVIIVGFLAVAAYQRGFDDASGNRRVWRAELVARRAAARTIAARPAVTLKRAS